MEFPYLGLLEGEAAGKLGSCSLHAHGAEAHESQKLERCAGYITHPAISEKQLSISAQDRDGYRLKMPWRNGSIHIEWHPVDLLAKLAALVPIRGFARRANCTPRHPELGRLQAAPALPDGLRK